MAMLSEQVNQAEADLLMKEYISLRSEIMDYVKLYGQHIRHVTAVLTITVALLSFAEKVDNIAHSFVFWFFVGITVTTAVSYYAFDALNAHYAMFATAARAALIEDMINERAGKVLLLWESKLSHRFWWDETAANGVPWWSDKGPIKGVNNPSKYLVGYLGAIVLIALFSEPLYATCVFWKNASDRALILLNWSYSVVSFVFVIRIARGVFWRIKQPAQTLAHQILNEAAANFQKKSAEQSIKVS